MKHIDNDFYQRIVEEALNGILVFSRTSKKCSFANPVARTLLEWGTDEEIQRMDFSHLIPHTDENRIACFSEDILEHEGFYQEVLLRKNSDLFIISNLGVKHFESSGEKYILLMIQDITLQKKLQREVTEKQAEIHRALGDLKKQNQQLRELDLAKNRFIALTTHELRTPLSAMVASAEVLQMGLYDSPEELEQFINLIYDQGLHLTQLVNDILDFAKIQAGKMDYFIEEGDLIPLLKSRIENFKSMASYADLEIKLDFKDDQKQMAYFDELRLQQVLDNMLNNAIKYNNPGGHIRIYLEDDQDIVKIFIEDTGRGIAADQLEKVFDEFETLGQVALHHQGTGLGMPISRKMIEAIGGKIHVKSELHKGSTFWIEIPTKKILPEAQYRSRSPKSRAA